LADAEDLGGARHMPALGHRNENAQLVKGHGQLIG